MGNWRNSHGASSVCGKVASRERTARTGAIAEGAERAVLSCDADYSSIVILSLSFIITCAVRAAESIAPNVHQPRASYNSLSIP